MPNYFLVRLKQRYKARYIRVRLEIRKILKVTSLLSFVLTTRQNLMERTTVILAGEPKKEKEMF